MESKFLVFKEVHPVDEKTGKLKDLKTKCFIVYGRRDLEHAYGLNKHTVGLGSIGFYPAWRKYVYWPEDGTLYDSNCLNDIAAFCEEQTLQWREGLKHE